MIINSIHPIHPTVTSIYRSLYEKSPNEAIDDDVATLTDSYLDEIERKLDAVTPVENSDPNHTATSDSRHRKISREVDILTALKYLEGDSTGQYNRFRLLGNGNINNGNTETEIDEIEV